MSKSLHASSLFLDKSNFIKQYQENDYMTFQSEDIARLIWEDILDKGAKKLYYKYLFTKVSLYMSEDFINKIRGVLELEYLNKEKEESKITFLNQWAEDDEAVAPKLDSWATLSIKKEIKFVNPNRDLYSGTQSQDDGRSSKSMSVKSARTKASVLARFKREGNNPPPDELKKQLSKKADPRNTIIEEAQLQRMPDSEKEEEEEDPEYQQKEERLRVDRENKIKERQEEIEKKRKKQSDDEIRKNKIKNMQAELKNKGYTYDYNFDIIYTKPPRHENFPDEVTNTDFNYKAPPVVNKQPYEQLGIKLKEQPKEEEVPEEPKDKKAQGKEANNLKNRSTNIQRSASQKKISANQDEEEDDGYIEGVFLPKQPPLHEILNPKQGVVINFENGFMKEGPLYVFPNRMNKEEYNKMVQEANKSVAAKRKVESILREKMLRDKEMESRVKGIKKKDDELLEKIKPDSPKNELEDQNAEKKKKVLIHGEEEWIEMMASEIKRVEKKLGVEKQVYLRKIKDPKMKEKIRNINIERMVAYPNIEELLEDFPLSSKLAAKPPVPTKLHKVIDEFNDKEILNNPSWGQMNFMGKKPDNTPVLAMKPNKESPLTSKKSRRPKTGLTLPSISNNNSSVKIGPKTPQKSAKKL